MKIIIGVVVGIILAAGLFAAGIFFGPKLVAVVPLSGVAEDVTGAKLAPVADKVAATETEVGKLKAAQAGFQTQLTDLANQLKVSVDALTKVVEEGQKAISARLESNEERFAYTQRLYEELKAAQASEPAAPPESAVPPVDKPVEVIGTNSADAEIHEEDSEHPLDRNPEAMGPLPVYGPVGDEDFNKVVKSSSVPDMNSSNIHVGPGGRKLKAIHKKDQCLPPNRLVRTNHCWLVGRTRVRCELTCQ